MLDIILENEDWYTQLKYKIFEIEGTDSLGQRLKVAVLWRDEADNNKTGSLNISLYLSDDLKIPGDMCKTAMDMFLEALKPIVPEEEYPNLNLKLSSITGYYGDLELSIWSHLPIGILNSIRLPEPVSDFIQPGYTDNLILPDDVIPIFSEGFKERANGLKKRIDKLYMGFKKGTFDGYSYVLPDKHDILIKMDEGKTKFGSKIINPHMIGFIFINSRDIKTSRESGGSVEELLSYVKERFKSFEITLID
jgi:hypothetical protein